MSNQWTPEPWDPWGYDERYGPIMLETQGKRIADFVKVEDRNRAQSCVNACQGMADPAKEIADLREAVRLLAKEWNKMNHHASCGDYANNIVSDGVDEGDYQHVGFMEQAWKDVTANLIARAAVEQAGGGA